MVLKVLKQFYFDKYEALTKQYEEQKNSLDKVAIEKAFKTGKATKMRAYLETMKQADDYLEEWSKNEDFWVRRIAIDHQLCRKEKTNTKLLEAILVNNFGSNEFFINKAIGWSLRDYSKTNPEWVKEFVEKYKDKMDKLSIKEASKYI